MYTMYHGSHTTTVHQHRKRPMNKFILGLAATAAIATPIAVAGTASAAGVARCQETVVIDTVSTTEATFTVNQPKDTVGQFDNVWKHVYTITVQPNGTF